MCLLSKIAKKCNITPPYCTPQCLMLANYVFKNFLRQYEMLTYSYLLYFLMDMDLKGIVFKLKYMLWNEWDGGEALWNKWQKSFLTWKGGRHSEFLFIKCRKSLETVPLRNLWLFEIKTLTRGRCMPARPNSTSLGIELKKKSIRRYVSVFKNRQKVLFHSTLLPSASC